MLNIFRYTFNVLPKKFESAEEAYATLTQDTPFSKAEFFKLGANAAGILHGAVYMFAFGIVKPVAFVKKHIFSKLDAPFEADGVVKLGAYVFAVLHVASILENVCEIGHQFQIPRDAKKRVADAQKNLHSTPSSNGKARAAARQELREAQAALEGIRARKEGMLHKIADCVMKLIAAMLEFASDLIRFIRPAAPSWIHIPINLGVALVGIVRIWVDTA